MTGFPGRGHENRNPMSMITQIPKLIVPNFKRDHFGLKLRNALR
jgi:hypothetical protein